MAVEIRDLTSLADCRDAVAVQHDVWGHDSETVPASLLVTSIKRGGILIGAHDAGRLIGFVWSMPAWRDGQPAHWSHMTGVADAYRNQGIGLRLKLAQRDRALALGVELIEWTFDPLQAINAHFNIARLGCLAAEYRVNAYGEMTGPLHRGTPTDRLVAEWWIGRPHVARRLPAESRDAPARHALPRPRDASILDAPAVIDVGQDAQWPAVRGVTLEATARRVLVPVPPRFSAMQQQATDLALAWRMATREVFTAYFGRGYRVVDFHRGPDGGGHYLLAAVP